MSKFPRANGGPSLFHKKSMKTTQGGVRFMLPNQWYLRFNTEQMLRITAHLHPDNTSEQV